MILLKIAVEIKPQKRTEFLQAMQSLILAAPPEPGCLERVVYQRIDDENAYCCLQVWESQEKMAAHLSTDRFKALLGAIQVLGEMKELSQNALYSANAKGEG
jgi:quinol monooxygenase YgiN